MEEEEHEEEDSAMPCTAASAEEHFEKLDISDTLASVVDMREVGNINDLPEELLLEIFLCLPPTTVLKVCLHSQTSLFLPLSCILFITVIKVILLASTGALKAMNSAPP